MSDYINTFSQYDNEVKITKDSFSPSGLVNTLIDKVSTLSNVQISKLNSLMSTFSVNIPFKNSAGDQINNLLNDQINKLTITTAETLENLSNATLSFAGNITENFIQDLSSYTYIEDEKTAKTIELMYNAGGVLTYDNNYIREQALKRDWNFTLSFIDKSINTVYNVENKTTMNDIEKMSKNSCKNNIIYVFDILYKDYQNLKNAVEANNTLLESYDKESEEYKQLEEITNTLQKYVNIYTETMIKNMKYLIVYSFDYVLLDDIKDIFARYPDVLKPKYFGDNDDTYGNEYTFGSEDIEIIAPFWVSDGSISQTDETLIDNNSSIINSQIQTAKDNNDQIYLNFLNQKKQYNNNLSSTISNGSINSLYEDRANNTKNSSGSTNSKFAIQYKNTPIVEIEKNVYIDPRNYNIKGIYIYLSSEEIHGDSRMINETLYNRLRYPFMTSAIASLDKALSYVTTGPVFSSLLKGLNTVEASIYEYVKMMDKSFLDPKYHNSVITKGLLDVDISLNLKETEVDEIEAPPEDPPTSTTNGTNNTTVETITVADNDPVNTSVKTELNNMIRFIDNIPAIDKVEIYKTYITFFYNYCIDKNLDIINIENKFESMILGIFNRTEVRTLTDFNKIFENMSVSYLNNSITTLISILFYNKESNCFGWNVEEDVIFIEAFRISVLLLSIDIYISGFIRTVYLYDKGQLSSGVKKYFNMIIELIESINYLDNPLYDLFYIFKDLLTTVMEGYDEFGVLYMDEKFNIQNTNVIVGDYNKIIKTVDGTFFLGTEQTQSGILKLSNNNELIETNITTGEWIDCYEVNTYTFFINGEKEVYTWNKNTGLIIATNLPEDFLEGFELLYSVSNGTNIFATSKTENIGIKKFNMSTFEFEDTDISTGYQWKLFDGVNGLFVFSPVSNNIYRYTQFGSFSLISDIDTGDKYYNSAIEFLENVTIKKIIVDPETAITTEEIEIVKIMYTAFGSNSNKGIKLLTNEDLDNLFNSQVSTGNIDFVSYYGNQYSIDYKNGNIGLVTKVLESDNISSNSNVINISYFYTKGKSVSILTEGRNGLYVLSVETNSSIDTNVLYSISPYNSNTITKINGLDSNQLQDVIILDNFDKNHSILYGNNIEGLYTLFKSSTECKKVLYNDENYQNSKTWNISPNSSDTYIGNSSFPNEYIKVLSVTESDSSLINTNLLSDKWIIVDFNNRGLALSINGYNKGIMKKDSSSIFSPTSIYYNDFKAFYVDMDKKQVFIGTYRLNDTLLNLNNINYNIDEHIYYLNTLDKQNIIINLIRGFLNILKEKVLDYNLDDLLKFVKDLLSLSLSVEKTISNYSLLGNSNNLLNQDKTALDFNIDDIFIKKDIINSILLNSPPSQEITNIILSLIGFVREIDAFDNKVNIDDFSNIQEYTEAYNEQLNKIDMCSDDYLNVNPYEPVTP